MKKRFVRPLALVLLSATLGGCAVTDTIGGGFGGGGTKSKLKGERISVMTSDESISPDTEISAMKVVLPPPYKNPDWPQPGGYPANAMYHLEAPGPLKQVW